MHPNKTGVRAVCKCALWGLDKLLSCLIVMVSIHPLHIYIYISKLRLYTLRGVSG